MNCPLRFGIMCYGTTLAAWEVECIKRLMALEQVSPALLIVDERPAFILPPPPPPWKRLWNLIRARNQLWVIYQRSFVSGRIPALEPVDASTLLAGVPRLTCPVVRKGKFSEYFTPEDIERIRKYDLDFVLRFAYGIIRGEILKVPRYGVWSFHHGDEEKYRGGPPGFWEIYFGEARTGVLLQRLTDRLDGGVPLKKSWFPTERTSFAKNRDAGLFGAADWPAAVCHDIREQNASYLDAQPSTTSAPVYTAPTNLQMIRFGLRLLRNHLGSRAGERQSG